MTGKPRTRRLGAGLVLRALIDDLAVVHVQLARIGSVLARDGLHVKVLDPVEVGQCESE